MAPFRTNPTSNMSPPPSGRHAMRCLYGIRRDSWVLQMSRHALARKAFLPRSGSIFRLPQCGPWLVYIRTVPRVKWLLLLLLAPFSLPHQLLVLNCRNYTVAHQVENLILLVCALTPSCKVWLERGLYLVTHRFSFTITPVQVGNSLTKKETKTHVRLQR